MTNIKHKNSAIKQFSVIIPVDIKPRPNIYEQEVARILAYKFQSDVRFVPPRYSLHTPDLQIVKTSEFWEIKNIRGNGKNTIEDNLKRAARQSNNVVISLLRTKMTSSQAAARIRYFLNHPHGDIKKVILVTKSKRAIEFYG